MIKRNHLILAVAVLCLALGGPGCILEEKVIEVVLTGSTCAVFVENHDTENFTTPVLLDYANEIDEILMDNGLSRDDIAMAKVMSATYQVTSFDHSHDWTISGVITVEWVGASAAETIVSYTAQSVEAAEPVPVQASLDADGVQVINDALADYLNGGYPMLRFEVVNGDVSPTPSEADRLVFTWESCIKVHILYQEELEVPDPL
jgi:hypothetical protein